MWLQEDFCKHKSRKEVGVLEKLGSTYKEFTSHLLYIGFLTGTFIEDKWERNFSGICKKYRLILGRLKVFSFFHNSLLELVKS